MVPGYYRGVEAERAAWRRTSGWSSQRPREAGRWRVPAPVGARQVRATRTKAQAWITPPRIAAFGRSVGRNRAGAASRGSSTSIARSSAAVARASDSRCAATWPLALRQARAQRRRHRAAARGVGELLDRVRRARGAVRRRAGRSPPGRARAGRRRARARRDSTAARRVFELRRGRRSGCRRAAGRVHRGGAWRRSAGSGASALDLASSSWALAISLSAIDFGVDLEGAVGDRLADAGDLLGVESASARREQRRGGARELDLGARVGRRRRRRRPAAALPRRPWPARRRRLARRQAAASGLVCGIADLHGVLQGPRRAWPIQHGRCIGPSADDFRLFCDAAAPRRRTSHSASSPGARRPAGRSARARFRCGPAPAGLRCRCDSAWPSPSSAEAGAGGDDLDGVAGGEPLPRLEVAPGAGSGRA